MNTLKKITGARRKKYEQRVNRAISKMKPSKSDMDQARAAATPPSTLSPDAYKRVSKSTFRATVLYVWTLWLLYMLIENGFFLFIENWFMSVTMVAGSFIAGSTSEGGGAVAFPVMTLMFDIKPACARNFSMAIQSVGMIAAAILIWRCKIPIAMNAIKFGALGGAIGVIFGTFYIVPLFTNPAFTKMFFTSTWLSFAVALFLINRDHGRKIFYRVVQFKPLRAGSVLVVAGVIGGVITSLTGSGLDIVIFALLTLRYRISEKVATPTSIVLMGINSLVGFLTHLFLVRTPQDAKPGEYWMGDFQMDALNYWLVCIPIVVIGAPLGARFIRNKSREFVVGILYVSIIIQFLGAILILKPTGWLIGFSIIVFLVGSGFFIFLAISGRNRIDLKMPLFKEMLN